MAAALGFLAVLGILTLFTFYMDGDTGVQLLAVFLLLPAASALRTFFARRQLRIRLTPAGKRQKGTGMYPDRSRHKALADSAALCPVPAGAGRAF